MVYIIDKLKHYRYMPLASPNPYSITVYSVANYRPHLSHFWANFIEISRREFNASRPLNITTGCPQSESWTKFVQLSQLYCMMICRHKCALQIKRYWKLQESLGVKYILCDALQPPNESFHRPRHCELCLASTIYDTNWQSWRWPL